MYCSHCGHKLKDDAKFCSRCGSPVETEGELTDLRDEDRPGAQYVEAADSFDAEDQEEFGGEALSKKPTGRETFSQKPASRETFSRKPTSTDDFPKKPTSRKVLPVLLICVAAAAVLTAVLLFMHGMPDGGKEKHAVAVTSSESTAESPAGDTAESPEKSTAESSEESTAESSIKSTVESSAESTAKSSAESAVSDADGDGLSDETEGQYGTIDVLYDSDRDVLSDADEIGVYHTDPLNYDTDGDGVDDGTEVMIGSDPNSPDMEFVTTQQDGVINEFIPVSVEAAAVTDAEGAGTLSIEPLTDPMQPALMPCAYGYLAPAYEFSCEGELESAVLTFSYDTALTEGNEDCDPTIYWYDEANDEFVEVAGQEKNNGTIRAVVTHFSVYTLMDKSVIDRLIDILPDFVDESQFLPDANNDKIPDLFAEYINDGTIKYSNTGMLIGALDIFGDSDDWDDDGLLNGEEIGFKPDLHGKIKITVRSNPYLPDSDGDGLDDYEEVRQLGTSPLRYDKSSVSAYNYLYYDSNYLYALHKEDWSDGLAKAFDGHKYDEAKSCLMDYFYEYAPEDSIRQNAEEIEYLTKFSEYVKYIGAVGDMLGIVKSLHSAANAAGDQEYYGIDPEEKARQLCGDQKALVQLKYSNDIDIIRSSQKFLKNTSDLGKSFEKIIGKEAIEGTKGVAGLIAEGYSIYTKCQKNHVFSLRSKMEKFTRYAKNPGGPEKLKGGTALTVACDIADGVEEIAEAIKTYAQLMANAEAYLSYLELLSSIRVNSDYDYIASAAGDIEKIIRDKSNNEFFKQLADKAARSSTETLAAIGLDLLAKTNPYAATAKILIDAYENSGLQDQAKYDIYFETMTEVSDNCRSILKTMVQSYDQTFSYYKEDEDTVYKYLVQLAQSRIIGEYYFYQYCAEQNLANWVSSILSGKSPQHYLDLFKTRVGGIYKNTNKLHLILSKKLPHYDLYYDGSAPEDHVRIPLSAERLFHNAAGKYTLTGEKESWKTEFVLYENGYFSGYYKAVEYRGVSSEKDDAEQVVSERTFTGRFTVGDPIEDYAFKLVLDEYNYEGIEDSSYTGEIAGEKVRHECVPAPGLEDVTEFVLYGPETPPEEVADPYRVSDYFIGTGDKGDIRYWFYREPIDFSILGSYHFCKAERSGAISIKDDSFVKEEDRREDLENKIVIRIENAQLHLVKNENYLYTKDMESEEENPPFEKDYIISRFKQNGEEIYSKEADYPLTVPMNRSGSWGSEDVYYCGDEEWYMDSIRFEGDYMIVSVYTFEAYNVFWFIKDR